MGKKMKMWYNIYLLSNPKDTFSYTGHKELRLTVHVV